MNRSLDKKMISIYVDIRAKEIQLHPDVFNIHPELLILQKVQSESERREIIDTHVNNFYEKHRTYLLRRKREFQQEWDIVEKQYLYEVQKLFHNHPFLKGEYIGDISIVNCNPRFLFDKAFQIFYAVPGGVKEATAHEVLHFIFYDYALKKFSHLFKTLDTETGIFWDISEIFNSIILSTPPFVKIHGNNSAFVYPQHVQYIPSLTRLWNKHQDVDAFIVEMYNRLAKQ